ncbi:CBL-interacting serine/threonine-protein kinase 4-like [Silene latifolia]|uniref:CBL-interacting serine/threonine-protein kinase 4-like n=1 Tax=Silene latifolia TaxID=37657 RepID=UPI003D772083
MAAAQSKPPEASSTTTDKIVMGKYQLGRLLGHGCFAKVYYARSLDTNKPVAIKIIDKHKTHPSIYPRIVGEVSAMRRLDHPNILRIHEVMATKQKIYLVMELAKGGDLAGKLSRRPDRRFPEPLARRCFHQLISALHYCHLNGVVHRDIKPQNLLLDGEGNVKVSDFGLSAVIDGPFHLLQTACGTPAFAAPEIVGRTQAGYDGAKADAWSCGVMLFVLLTGNLPFDHANLALMYRKMRNKEFRFPSWVSKPARGLITRLLDPNPETRMSIEEVVKDTWLKNQGMVYPRSISLGDLASLGEKENKIEKRSKMMERTASMNAFEIISMSSGLNLSGLFETAEFLGRRDRRLPARAPVETVVEEVEQGL